MILLINCLSNRILRSQKNKLNKFKKKLLKSYRENQEKRKLVGEVSVLRFLVIIIKNQPLLQKSIKNHKNQPVFLRIYSNTLLCS